VGSGALPSSAAGSEGDSGSIRLFRAMAAWMKCRLSASLFRDGGRRPFMSVFPCSAAIGGIWVAELIAPSVREDQGRCYRIVYRARRYGRRETLGAFETAPFDRSGPARCAIREGSGEDVMAFAPPPLRGRTRASWCPRAQSKKG
jgi:hypothetical protein